MEVPELSPHAARRAVEMCLGPDEIVDMLTRPVETWPAKEHGVWFKSNGKVAAIVNVERGYVITFVWRRRAAQPRFNRDDLSAELERIRDAGSDSAHH